jgi:predicted  nucleic acid-binding Zn-ribbon protein
VQAGFNAESGRVFRPVFFDVFGNTVYRPDIDKSFKTLKQAQADFWKQSEELDAIALTLDGIEQKQADIERELQQFKKLAKELQQ